MPILDTGNIYRYAQLVKDINLIMMVHALKPDVMKANDLCEMMVVIAHIYRYVVCQLSKSQKIK